MMNTLASSGFSFGQDIPKERVTLALPCITTDHAYIHDSKAFSLEGTLAANGTNTAVIAFNPPAAAAAKATAVMTDTDANILYTFKTTGTRGNVWDVVHTDPSGNSKSLAVTVVGTVVNISLATNSGGTIISTAAQVVAAVNASPAGEYMTASLVSTGGTVNAVAKVDLAGGADDVYIHFKATDITAAADIVTVDIIEGATFTGTAATFTAYNRNRSNPVATRAAITGTLAATVTTTSAVLLDHLVARGSASGPNTAVHSSMAGEELVFDPGKAYVVRIVPTGATAIDYKLFWYEEDGA
jgi:hypothetical protein